MITNNCGQTVTCNCLSGQTCLANGTCARPCTSAGQCDDCTPMGSFCAVPTTEGQRYCGGPGVQYCPSLHS